MKFDGTLDDQQLALIGYQALLHEQFLRLIVTAVHE